MFKKLNPNLKFIGGACIVGVLVCLVVELVVNKLFPQPVYLFSISRLIAVAAVTSGTLCLLKYRAYFLKNLHKAFLLIALAFGMSFILVFPRTVYMSADDQIHFRNAYFFMHDTVELKGGFAVAESWALTDFRGKGFDELSAVYAIMEEQNQTVIDAQYHVDEPRELYSRIAYLPFHLGLEVADFFGLSFPNAIALAKICNLFCYVLLIYFAIKASGKFAKLFFIIGLLASNIFLATQFSYDPIVTASLLLAIALFLHMRQMDKVTPGYLMGFILAATLGSLTKAVYCPILLLVWMIPNDRFDCKKRALAFKICTMIVMLVLASTFVLPMLGGGLASDIRGGNTSVSGQISFLLNNPITGIMTILNFILSALPERIFGTASFSYLGGLESESLLFPIMRTVWVLSLLILLWITFRSDLSAVSLTKRSKIGFALIYAILAGAIIMSMYLSFTEVGSKTIGGVQARYFMPMLPLLLMTLMPVNRLCPQETARGGLIIFVPYLCLILVFMLYVLTMSKL